MDLSPDGHTLVFSGTSDGGRGLFLLNLSSHRVTRLNYGTGDENDPAFSPDGRSIVYQGAKSLDQPRHLYVHSLDGKHVRQLTGGAAVEDSYPSFSRDGKQIVFSRAQNFHLGSQGEATWDSFDVYVVGADGSHLRRLARESSQGVIRPVFSPDGKSVLYERTRTNSTNANMQIVRIGSDGKSPAKVVISVGTMAFSPTFFPNGREMAFASNDGRGPELYVYDLQHGTVRCLNARRYGDGTGGWSPKVAPDNETIYFLMGYDAQLWRIGTNGQGAQKIADGTLVSDPAAWKP